MRNEVEMCGDGWKTENGVLLFIYTSVITVSIASNSSTNIPQVARYHYPLSHCCSFGAVFALISFISIVPLSIVFESSCLIVSSLVYPLDLQHCIPLAPHINDLDADKAKPRKPLPG